MMLPTEESAPAPGDKGWPVNAGRRWEATACLKEVFRGRNGSARRVQPNATLPLESTMPAGR